MHDETQCPAAHRKGTGLPHGGRRARPWSPQGRDAVGGNAQAFTAFKATRNAIEQNVSTLQGRYGKEPGVSGAIATLGDTWAPKLKNFIYWAWVMGIVGYNMQCFNV